MGISTSIDKYRLTNFAVRDIVLYITNQTEFFMTITRARLIRHCKDNVDHADRVVAQFVKTFSTQDPTYALQWGDDAVLHSAVRELSLQTLWSVERDPSDDVVSKVTAHVQQQLQFCAANPSSSTSAMANLVDHCRVTALARLASFLTE